MSAPIEIPISAKQRELWEQLLSDVRMAQSHLNLFCDTLFRSQGVSGVQHVQVLDDKTGPKLVGVVPDAPEPKAPEAPEDGAA